MYCSFRYSRTTSFNLFAISYEQTYKIADMFFTSFYDIHIYGVPVMIIRACIFRPAAIPAYLFNDCHLQLFGSFIPNSLEQPGKN